ncbi:amidohydrolase family protein [Sphingomonas immobilis]|uniref:Amidohydrolase family protein n=1 Tax=Sphingomonas immobilis TaxID=3063997 RepID=A0ABT9A416_9SPHN|nr:amidohydrolase family protein [Sphingomonas sp. CA1-15]MDO7844555.1 amidohydrolase family protein [Sphingomonas sp. CA1-15]
MISHALLRLALAGSALLSGLGAPPPSERQTLIRGARVFDGSGTPAVIEDVLIEDGRIAAIGTHLTAPPHARIVDAKGMTLIPGLHDLHTHLRAPAYDAPDDMGKAWAGYLVNGITTVDDFSVAGEMLAPIREMAAAHAPEAPHLNLAIRLGVPGGHGTEFGWGDMFTLQATTPRAAHLAMAKALPYKPDLIKVFADGWRYGRDPDLNSMNVGTLSAIVEDAHKAGLPVITHTVTLEGAKVAAAAGVDAVGHGVGDAPVDDDLIALMKAHHTAYIPTLVVYEPQQERRFVPGEYAALSPPERKRETAYQTLLKETPEPVEPYDAKRWAIMQDNIRRVKAAGIRIGIGTDSGIGGVYHGPGAIREITWLTKLGFTPAEALVAATSTSADIIGQAKDHGRIAPGMRADVVLVKGRPDEDIAALWNVAQVFVAGRAVQLEPLRKLLASDAPTPLPVHPMSGPIDTGARGDGRTDLDTLPVEGTEAGSDHSDVAFVRPDAQRLFLLATMGARAQPYAQLNLPLTKGSVQLADARGFTGVVFEARGNGDYALLFDSYALDQDAWFKTDFTVAAGARSEVRIPFTAFRSADPAAKLDLAKLRTLIVRLKGTPGGTAWLQLEKVRFY